MMSVHLLPETRDDGTLTPAFLVVRGRASALFAVLAGVGLALATGGHRPRLHPRAGHRRHPDACGSGDAGRAWPSPP